MNLRLEAEARREREYAVFSAVQRIAEVVREEIISVRENRTEFLEMMVSVCEELLSDVWHNVRPDWVECNCGLNGCGDWMPHTPAEAKLCDEVLEPVHKLLQKSGRIIEEISWEDD